MKFTSQDVSALLENITGMDDVIGHCSPWGTPCPVGPCGYAEDQPYTPKPAEDK